MPRKIHSIDEDEEYNLPDSSDFDEPVDEDEYMDEKLCQACNGTGEGVIPELTCPYCLGIGIVKKKT